MSYRMVTWPMTSRDLERSNPWPQYAESAISRELLELETLNLINGFVWGMPSRRTNNFPRKWAWPRSRDPYNSWHTIEHIFKTTWASDFKFCTRLCLTIAVWLSGSAYYSLLRGSTIGYPSDSLASCSFYINTFNKYFFSHISEVTGWLFSQVAYLTRPLTGGHQYSVLVQKEVTDESNVFGALFDYSVNQSIFRVL